MRKFSIWDDLGFSVLRLKNCQHAANQYCKINNRQKSRIAKTFSDQGTVII